MLEGDTRQKIVQIVRKPAQHPPRTRPLEEIKADALLLRVDVNDVSHVVAELATRPTPAMALGKVKADLLLRNQLRWSLLVLLVSVLVLALVVRWRTDAWRPAVRVRVRVRVRGLLRRRRRRGRRRGILLLSEQGGPRRACRLLAADDGHGLMMIGLDSLLAEGMNLRWKTENVEWVRPRARPHTERERGREAQTSQRIIIINTSHGTRQASTARNLEFVRSETEMPRFATLHAPTRSS